MYALNLIEFAQNTPLDSSLSAFENFLSDGKVNDPDMYLSREFEDFTSEFDFAVMNSVGKYVEEDNSRVIDMPESDYMLTA